MNIKLKVTYADPKTQKKYKPGDIVDLPMNIAQLMIKNDMAVKRIVKPSKNREK